MGDSFVGYKGVCVLEDNNLLYLSGLPHTKVANSEIINKVVQLVEDKVKELDR